MMKNRLIYTFLLPLLVILILCALQLLSPPTVVGYELRPVHILADVCHHSDEGEIENIDTLPQIKPTFQEECPPGVTLIQDYQLALSDTAIDRDTTIYVGRGMSLFYESLEQSRSLPHPVRIAYFGDSFIEGDIMTADLRSMLQDKFGGCGVGFVDIASPTAGFRTSVRSYSHGWGSHCITDTVHFDRSRQGIAERFYNPMGVASVTLSGIPGLKSLHRDTCTVSSIFYRTDHDLSITARINGRESQSFFSSPSDEVQYSEVRGRMGRVQWSVVDSIGSTFFGVTMESEHGVILDNFSLRGSSGISIGSIPEHTLREFARVRPYNLIVLQFGLNVANRKTTNYSNYQHRMEQVVRKLAISFPEASILIVGVGDRGERRDGTMVTMRGVKQLISYQQQLAYLTGCSFWNMYEAMGGEGSIALMADAKPSLANKDYTHVNSRGGKHLGLLLYKALIAGKTNYERRKAFDTSTETIQDANH